MDLFAAAERVRRVRRAGYAAAILLPAAALWLRMLAEGWLTGYPFLTFFPAVVLTAFVGGALPGLLATALSAALAWWQLVAPGGSFAPQGIPAWLVLLLFLVGSGAVVGLIHLMTGAYGRLAASDRALRQLNVELERRVAERTQALEATNAELAAALERRDAVEAQNRQLQKMEAIGQLAGGIAHDFNNMLSVMMGSLSLARRRLSIGNVDVMHYIDNALEGANRAASLTRSVLAFSRQQPLEPASVDANKLVAEMSEVLRRTLGETVTVECVLAGGLWRAFVDPGQLQGAIINLAVNARDAMPGGGKLTIETANVHLDEAYAAANSEVSPGSYVLITITDTGSGIASDILPRIFDPFFTTKEVGKGTGLGLSQVYGFIKQSSGHIAVYSEPGVGSSFKLYLPRDARPARDLQVVRTVFDGVLPRGAPGERILVVEDDAQVRRTNVEGLRELGYTVHHAGNGGEALELLQTLPEIHLLFTDVVMPGMGGRELAQEVLRRRPATKVLFTTGYTRNAIVHGGTLDPHLELLSKPYAIDQLARKVRGMLDRRPAPLG